MPRPVTDTFWERQVFALAENEPAWSARAIYEQLLEIAQESDRRGCPSDRTVARMLKTFRERSAVERGEYRAVQWPEAMVAELLPWEASAHALELLRYTLPEGRRPIVRLVRWFHRVSLAAADAPFEERFRVAVSAAVAAVLDDTEATERTRRAVEGYLAYAPWRSDQAKTEYEEAVQSEDAPVPILRPGNDLAHGGKQTKAQARELFDLGILYSRIGMQRRIERRRQEAAQEKGD